MLGAPFAAEFDALLESIKTWLLLLLLLLFCIEPRVVRTGHAYEEMGIGELGVHTVVVV